MKWRSFANLQRIEIKCPHSVLMQRRKSDPEFQILSGWKDIANDLGMGVRTEWLSYVAGVLRDAH